MATPKNCLPVNSAVPTVQNVSTCEGTPQTNCSDTYDGVDVLCANLLNGMPKDEALALLANLYCQIKQEVDTIDVFSCSMLSSCSIAELADVALGNLTVGDILMFDGTNFSNVQLVQNTYSAINGISEFPSGVFRLGGDLVANTIISGENFDLHLGTDMSLIDFFSIKANILDATANIISLNTTDATTQNKGFRFDGSLKSISIGTDVFNAFSADGDCTRIGDNITINNTIPAFPSKGTYIGQNISIKDTGIGTSFGLAMGKDIDLDFFVGAAIGKDIAVTNGIGGFILGTDIAIQGGATGSQFAFALGNNIDIAYSAGIGQSSLVFNPTSVAIKSSPTGLAAGEKIKVDDTQNRIITVFNADEYYFFTNTANSDGWSVNEDIFKITKDYIRVSKSMGSVAGEEVACIRYNSAIDKYQGYTTATGWTDLH